MKRVAASPAVFLAALLVSQLGFAGALGLAPRPANADVINETVGSAQRTPGDVSPAGVHLVATQAPASLKSGGFSTASIPDQTQA